MSPVTIKPTLAKGPDRWAASSAPTTAEKIAKAATFALLALVWFTAGFIVCLAVVS